MTTARGIITSAMRKIGALTKGEPISADEASDGLEMLNDLLASLSNDSLIVYARTFESFTLSGGVSAYTIGSGATFDTVRPIKIISAYVRDAQIDYPLEIATDEQYAGITLKTSQGRPEFINYTNAYPTATINLYPTPSIAYTLHLVTEKQLSSFTLNQTVDLPPGWRRMLINNLAIEMGPEYGQSVPPEVIEVARESKGEIKTAIMSAKPMNWETDLGAEGNIYSGWYT